MRLWVVYRLDAEVSHLSTVDHVVESLHDLLCRRVTVETMELHNVNKSTQLSSVSRDFCNRWNQWQHWH